MEVYQLLDGRVRIYKRPGSNKWQCSTYLAGKERRTSTRQDVLARAEEWAEDWYFGLRGKKEAGLLTQGKTFREVAKQFEREYTIITRGQRSPTYVQGLKDCLRVHVLPFFGDRRVADITGGTVQEYRIHRLENPRPRWNARENAGPTKPPTLKTLNNEIIVVRQVLKTALRHGWLTGLPDLSQPYQASGKIQHRGWFSHAEYKQLYTATRRRAIAPLKAIWKHECEQMHDFVLFMANTGLRPDEAWRLEYRDVHVVQDDSTGEVILEIEVRGKRGVGHCKSMPGAVTPFRRLRKRNHPQPTDRLFPSRQRELFNNILVKENLKVDRDGNRRTAYSLRHTYICFRLMEGADIYQVAKNCRTSVEMIEKHYAIHLKDTIDAASVNVRRDRKRRAGSPASNERRDQSTSVAA
ncbi:MAG: tyrosine-type recombinase/integrase [Planctomycetota bacterium]